MTSTSNGSVKIISVDSGWANNSVNTAVFRKNSLITHGDIQFVAFYNHRGNVVLGKRSLHNAKWELLETRFRGRVNDAHNVISIMVDGNGYLHMAWDHHNNKLHYARSVTPGSLQLEPEQAMTGKAESKVSYPEFYRLKDGSLLFFYRDGGSGNGNLVINKYDVNTGKWATVHSNLIEGEGERNAYWQACVDEKGNIHVSWVWRESPDVSSNHDLCYALSRDGGMTWEKSTGEKYALPITMSSAEIAAAIPQKSELINQTSMFADHLGAPYIATYWRSAGSDVPQYHVVFKKNNAWHIQNLGFRKTPFSLSGVGTKRIPISRPQIVTWQRGDETGMAVIFRDEERGNRVSAAVNHNIDRGQWKVFDLTDKNMGSWEPTYDTELWKQKKWLHLFVQRTEQIDAEGTANIPPQIIEVLEWSPLR